MKVIRRHSSKWLAVAGAAALVVGVLGLGITPAMAKSTKPKVLLHDSLRKPSKAVKPSVNANESWTFVNHAFLGQSLALGTEVLYYPTFTNQGTIGLGDVSVSVDVALRPNPQVHEAGVGCRAQTTTTGWYVLAIRSDGGYYLFKDVGGKTTGSLATGTVKVRKSNHLTLTCGGPTQPGPTDAVTFTGSVNGQTFATQDSAGLPGGSAGLAVGSTSQGPGAATFRNLKITQP